MTNGTKASEINNANIDKVTDSKSVKITVDGKDIIVPADTNLIEAAKCGGVEIPHYCYHPHLSIAGNCRMCQVEVVGMPKLTIACNTMVKEGMEVRTHFSSSQVKDAQAATLEFILANHPLDCTVCDQAGHCKLQDYHYEYNTRPSRFLEEKEHKVKALPLGPTVVLDGERCIMCTRCIRFCDEVTETSELGMLNRGDRSVIAVNDSLPLANPLSGSVVDLCPVGALTHRHWRFNTRIWFTEQFNGICPGCSTGCNVRVATRDNEIVQVKANRNDVVNKEWLCDEGRYGFNRFIAEERVVTSLIKGKQSDLDQGLNECKVLLNNIEDTLFIFASDLLLEDYWISKEFLSTHLGKATYSIAYRSRNLTKTEEVLISPNYAANFVGAQFMGLATKTEKLEENYKEALHKITSGRIKSLVLVGDRAILPEDVNDSLVSCIRQIPFSCIMGTDLNSTLVNSTLIVLPTRNILERSGLMINSNHRLQYTNKFLDFPENTQPVSRIFSRLGVFLSQGKPNSLLDSITLNTSDRDVTRLMLKLDPRLSSLSISTILKGSSEFLSGVKVEVKV
jgi:NADH-quinone oxidoreductase subunit G